MSSFIKNWNGVMDRKTIMKDGKFIVTPNYVVNSDYGCFKNAKLNPIDSLTGNGRIQWTRYGVESDIKDWIPLDISYIMKSTSTFSDNTAVIRYNNFPSDSVISNRAGISTTIQSRNDSGQYTSYKTVNRPRGPMYYTTDIALDFGMQHNDYMYIHALIDIDWTYSSGWNLYSENNQTGHNNWSFLTMYRGSFDGINFNNNGWNFTRNNNTRRCYANNIKINSKLNNDYFIIKCDFKSVLDGGK